MAIVIEGFRPGEVVPAIQITKGVENASIPNIASFKRPAVVSGLPRVSSTHSAGDTVTMDTTGLGAISAYAWREVGGAVLAATQDFDSTSHGGKWVEPGADAGAGLIYGPAVLILDHSDMGDMTMSDHAAMVAGENAAYDIVRHDSATHIAIGNGSWSLPANWQGGVIPGEGAKVVIPHGVTMTYDETRKGIRLDSIRVDGSLRRATDRSTHMLVEHLIITRMGTYKEGEPGDEIPAQYECTTTISGQTAGFNAFGPTDMDLVRDPKLIGRGLVNFGNHIRRGARKMMHVEPTAGIPMGATSCALQQIPTGWAVGDQLMITGMRTTYSGSGLPGYEDEFVTLTDVTGNAITWDIPLVYSHENRLSGSTRTDVVPQVMLHRSRNVVLQSEVTAPVWRRGHQGSFGHHAKPDKADGCMIEMGRTDKSVPAGKKDSNGDFAFLNERNNTNVKDIQIGTFTAQSNVQGRYADHFHHNGFDHAAKGKAMPITEREYFDGSPGWLISHHSCEAIMRSLGGIRFFGAGMVAEQGNEVGDWVDCCFGHHLCTTAGLDSVPKTREDQDGIAGDTFRHGYPYALRGRAIRMSRNIGFGASYAFVYLHRGAPANETLVPPLWPKRRYLDIGNDGVGQGKSSDTSLIPYTDPPIGNNSDCKALTCGYAGYVTKGIALQGHDTVSQFEDLHTWGYRTAGLQFEYVLGYTFRHLDSVKGQSNSGSGLHFGSNMHQAVVYGAWMEGAAKAFLLEGLDTTSRKVGGIPTYSHDDPRWALLATDVVDCAAFEEYGDQGETFPFDPLRLRDEKMQDGPLDYSVDPSHTFNDGNTPLLIGTYDGVTLYTGGMANTLTNADGKKVDSLGALAEIATKTSADVVFVSSNPDARLLANTFGYYQWNGGNVAIQDFTLFDRQTGRPAKWRGIIELQALDAVTVGTDQGALNYSATPITAPDINVTVPVGGSVVIDMLAGATGGDGPEPMALDIDGRVSPKRGRGTWDAAAGTITYTPDPDIADTDYLYAFVTRNGRFKTRRVNILIGGTEQPVPALSHNTNFVVTDHADANTIGVQLTDPPDIDSRRFEMVQYSTDAGVTWRRLCHRWRPAVHKVTMQSDNSTAIAPGAYNLRLRYFTDHDNLQAADSADVAVVAT